MLRFRRGPAGQPTTSHYRSRRLGSGTWLQPRWISFKDLCIDAVDPELLASFWAAALGLRAEPSGSDFRLVDDVPEHTLWVNKVPEPRTVKQRVHLDVHVVGSL